MWILFTIIITNSSDTYFTTKSSYLYGFMILRTMWGVPARHGGIPKMDGVFHGNPDQKWMLTGGTLIYGNPHMQRGSKPMEYYN